MGDYLAVVRRRVQDTRLDNGSSSDSIKPEQVRMVAAQISPRIIDNYKKLNRVAERFEAKIQKRWIKMSKLKRREILLQAWPHMAASHRPDLQCWNDLGSRGVTKEEVDFFKWPYMSIEDLSKKEPLLLMLNSRGHNSPAKFCASDLASTRLGRNTDITKPAVLRYHAMVFNDKRSPSSYGQLYCERDNVTDQDRARYNLGCKPGEGLLILSIQDRIYKFLLDCCRFILHDISEESLLDSKLSTAAETRLEYEANAPNEARSLAIINYEAPYRVPAPPDLDIMDSVILAGLSKAKDHLWLLRESPAYFANSLAEIKDHVVENVMGINGRPGPYRTSPNHCNTWGRAASFVVRYAVDSVYKLTYIHEKIVKLRESIDRCGARVSSGTHLPAPVASAVADLYIHLQHYSSQASHRLVSAFTSSPPVRSYVYCYYDHILETHGVGTRPNIESSRIQTSVAYIMSVFSKDLHVKIGAKTLLTEYELKLQKHPGIKDLISERVAHLIAEFSVLVECMAQLEVFVNIGAGFDSMPFILGEHAVKISESFVKSEDDRAHYLNCDLTRYNHLFYPTEERFYYPERKPRTKENVEAMRKAESNLDEIWETALGVLRQEKRLSPEVGSIFHSKNIQRTDPWVAAPTSLPSTRLNRVPARPAPAASIPFGGFQEAQEIKLPFRPAGKTKVKTRGKSAQNNDDDDTTAPQREAAQAGEGAANAEGTEQQKQQQQAYKVDKRSLKVFRALFHDPSASGQPGEISWTDYLHALTSLGFSARKLGGSAWHFEPPADLPGKQTQQTQQGRPIGFHEPHPGNKLPLARAREYGRRLQRAYGWSGDMFVLDD